MSTHTLKVRDFLDDHILVGRESARRLEGAIRAALELNPPHNGELSKFVVDFEGIQGIAPSFLDEMFLILDAVLAQETVKSERSIALANPPTRLSLKFEAVARGHGLSIAEQSDGSWLLWARSND